MPGIPASEVFREVRVDLRTILRRNAEVEGLIDATAKDKLSEIIMNGFYAMKEQSTGQWLSITRANIEACGRKTRAEIRLERGAVFRLFQPLV
jgi:hypothetical protein